MPDFTHLDAQGNAIMVDVSQKETSVRQAVATGKIKMSPECFKKVREGGIMKGDVLGVARIAGIMATKQTGALIPLCHPLSIEHASVEFEFDDGECVADGTAVDGECAADCTAVDGECAVDNTAVDGECAVTARCSVKTTGATGVEMEALTGVTVALLTIYDMCKAIDKGMELCEIYLLEKTGGKSGVYRNEKRGC